MRLVSIAGRWQVTIDDGKIYEADFPGSLDENRIGYPDDGSNQWKGTGEDSLAAQGGGVINTRFTRHYTYEGPARISRTIEICKEEGEQVYLEVERSRKLSLYIDGQAYPSMEAASICAPYRFDLGDLPNGLHEITLVADNSYPDWPRDAIVFSSAATDETQTNWNGLLGYLQLRYVPATSIDWIGLYPEGDTLTAQIDLRSKKPFRGRLRLESAALEEPFVQAINLDAGLTRLEAKTLPLDPQASRWDEGRGHLHTVRVVVEDEDGQVKMEQETSFGIRDFKTDAHGRLAINGRGIFVRSETNCATFPKTGYPPMDKNEWLTILRRFMAYGVNLMRFHSHTPPLAAFEAADELGMLILTELSHWDAETAFEADESYRYYGDEMEGILRMLANHPSFVMFSWGNELVCNELGMERMTRLISRAREIDPTRLYANASNGFYGLKGCDPASDFYTSQKFEDADLRGSFAGPGIPGFINQDYPNTKVTYDEGMDLLRQTYDKAVYSFEVGQFEVLPDFAEIEFYDGVVDPANYRLIRDKVQAAGYLEDWPAYVEASGELSLIGYRAEVEAAMRTRSLSGLSLLALQDFPGQGTALVGMLDARLQPKPYDFARPERFQAFMRSILPLLLLDKFTYEAGETLRAKLQLAHYERDAVTAPWGYSLEELAKSGERRVLVSESFAEESYAAGKLHDVGAIEIVLPELAEATRLDLHVWVGEHKNVYPIWIYPTVDLEVPASVYETRVFDDEAKRRLAEGGIVYLSPPSTKEALPNSIQAQFTTDFWSVGTFPTQEGGMGQLIDAEHPAFRDFPTEFHSNWQWWPMARQRAIILPEQIKRIITEMDSYAYLRPMAKLFECRVGAGRLLVSSMGLQDLGEYPEARALLYSLYRYMDSDRFQPGEEHTVEWVEKLFEAVNT